MKVVKFVRSEENGGLKELYFELCDRLADYIRHWTEYEDDPYRSICFRGVGVFETPQIN